MTDLTVKATDRARAGSRPSPVPPPRRSRGPAHRLTVPGATSNPLALLTVPIRIFLAAGWLRAGAEKVISPEWWSGQTLHDFLQMQHDVSLPFFQPVMQTVLMPTVVVVAAVVAISQLLIGLAIAVGRPLRLALWCGIALNVVFVLTGRVNPSAFYLVMEAMLLMAASEGIIGRRATVPSRRSLVGAGGLVVIAAALAPFIHTMQPEAMIDDPAAMLVFLSLMMAGTAVYRWVDSTGLQFNLAGRITPQHVRSWLACWPKAAESHRPESGLQPSGLAATRPALLHSATRGPGRRSVSSLAASRRLASSRRSESRRSN